MWRLEWIGVLVAACGGLTSTVSDPAPHRLISVEEAINLARAAFDQAQSEPETSRQGTGLLGRLIGRHWYWPSYHWPQPRRVLWTMPGLASSRRARFSIASRRRLLVP